MQTPVVFIVFNRPDVTAKVFARIREARPDILYIICDGPRSNRADDAQKVASVRAIIEQGIDWPCRVIRDYSENNLGCRHRVATGLNNVFNLFDQAIVLEDDCLPDPSFFQFCTEMLERYRDQEDVMHVSGSNIAPSGRKNGYRYSRHSWIWGWASWSRAWRHYDFEMNAWEQRHGELRSSFASAWEAQFWIAAFDQARHNFDKVNTWDFSWMFTVRSLNGLCLVPNVNLIENIGIGVDSTHTSADSGHLRVPASAIHQPLMHPLDRNVDRFADELITRTYCRQTSWRDSLLSIVRTFLQRQSFDRITFFTARYVRKVPASSLLQ